MTRRWRGGVAVATWAAATAAATAISVSAVSEATDRIVATEALAVPPARQVTAAAATATPSTAPAADAAAPAPPPTPTPTAAPALAAPPLRHPASARGEPFSSETFGSPAGVVTVECRGDAIRLVSARPNDGYRLDVIESGPERVVVVFSSQAERRKEGYFCRDGSAHRFASSDTHSRDTEPPRKPAADGSGGR